MLRRYLTRNIRQALDDFPVIIITGARQVGKSTLVQSLLNDWKAQYVTLDDRLFLDSAINDPDGFLETHSSPLVIDEAQRVPDLFRAVKKRVDADRKPGQYILTGSANLLNIPQIGETLAGRAALLELHSFSWAELAGVVPSKVFIKAFEFGHSAQLASILPKRDIDRKKEIEDRIIAGYYPTPAQMKTAQARLQWYKSYRQTYVENDVRQIATIEHIPDFNRLYLLLASRTGRLLNKADLSRDSGLAYATLHRYLNIMETTYQVRLINPYYANVAKRLVKTPKIYLTDTGMAAHLLALDDWQDAEKRELVGQLVETWVANELTKLISVIDPRMQVMFWRTALGHEVDFLILKGVESVAIEVKWSSNLSSRDFNPLQALAKDLGHSYRMGILLYSGTEVVSIDSKTIAIPFGVFFGLNVSC